MNFLMRFSHMTFVRHTGSKSIVWHPRSGGCVILEGAAPFLKHIDWTGRRECEVVADIAADFGMRPEEVAGDFREFIAPLAAEGFVVVADDEGREAPTAIPAEKQSTTEHENFDAEGDPHDDSWMPLGDFFKGYNIPVELHIDLSAACTERCVHCYLPDYPVKHLPFDLVDKALREFRSMQGLSIHLTGGECMLHPDFDRVCSLCRELNLNFVILSNLTVCDEKRIEFLSEVQPQFINVSLYSMDEQEHDAITQLPGSWRRTMEAILGCEKAGIPIRLATPLLKENKNAFPALARFAGEHRMHLIPSIDIVPQSDHDCANMEHACTSVELREALEANKDLFNRGWDDPLRAVENPDSKVCDIGVSRLYLNSSGNYYPCDSMHGYILGNVATDTLESVWNGERLGFLKHLANRDFPKCLACANRPFCKVCPAFNFNATGDLFKTIPAKCAIAATVREVYGGK